MANVYTKVVANFTTNLATSISVAGLTATLQGNTTKDGATLPNGKYCFCVNQGKSNEQHFVCTLTGKEITAIYGVDRLGNVSVGALKGADINDEIKITDYVNLKWLVDDVDALNTIIAGIMASGSPDASTTVRGISMLSASPDTVKGNPTITIATPAVATLTAHGLIVNDSIKFSTTGTLPTGITAGVTYYVIASGLTANTFQFSTTLGGAAVNTSGSQSGTHTVTRTTPIAVSPNDPSLLTANEKAALAGTVGTPKSTNLFVTQDNKTISGNDQTQTTQNGTIEFGEADATTKKNILTQSFIPTRTKERGFALYKSPDTGTFTGSVTISLQADNAGSASGTPLASVTISNADWLLLTPGEFQAIFSSEYSSLTVGSLYWIVAQCSTADNANHPNLGTNTAGGYASGSIKYKNTTDGYVAFATADLYFKTLEGNSNQVVQTKSDGYINSRLISPAFFQRLLGIRGTASDVVVCSIAATSDGSVLYALVNSNSAMSMNRYARDGITGQYIMTHTVGASAINDTNACGLVVVGGYLYQVQTAGGVEANSRYYRYDGDTLANATACTGLSTEFSVLPNAVGLFYDSANGFVYIAKQSTASWSKYTVSGTTWTDTGVDVTFTTLGSTESVSFDGTYVYLTSFSNPTTTIRKYTLAGTLVGTKTYPTGLIDTGLPTGPGCLGYVPIKGSTETAYLVLTGRTFIDTASTDVYAVFLNLLPLTKF